MKLPEVYITRAAKFLPNEAVPNDSMEDYLGKIDNQASRGKAIVLRNNGIESRYYALDKDGNLTHTNAEMAAHAINRLFEGGQTKVSDVDLLSCATSSPDQMMPSHAVMVHGLLPDSGTIEVVSPSGVCCAGMHAFKYAFMSLRNGESTKAVACASERLSSVMRSTHFEEEVQDRKNWARNPYLSFEKEFLRWMLSDGAGAFLMQTAPTEGEINLKVEWIDACSFANRQETCMYMGADKNGDGSLKSFKDYGPDELINKSVMAVKQDVKLLKGNIVELGFRHLTGVLQKRGFDMQDVDHFLPHMSSYFFEDKIAAILEETGNAVPREKWFTNLRTVGNVGAASIYLMVEELMNSGRLKKGEKIFLAVPESSRFSYVYSLLTVC